MFPAPRTHAAALGRDPAAGRAASIRLRVPRPRALIPIALFILLLVQPLWAADPAQAPAAHGGGATLLWIAVLLLSARFAGLVERLGQPSVLGELVVGVVLGNLVLVGMDIFAPITADPVLRFLAELGVVILLFQIGLESNLAQMGRVGVRALSVAIVGVVLPFALGSWVVGPWLMPGLPAGAYLFIGAAMTATSVGITARVFRDLGALGTAEAQIVLGAAVIDDVLGLIILAVISAAATVGTVGLATVGLIVFKAAGFLIGAVVLGRFLAPRLGRLLSRAHAGAGMKLTLALGFALVLAYLAGAIGLAPIVGAFAAGLVLDAVHFEDFEEPAVIRDVREGLVGVGPGARTTLVGILDRHSRRHVEDLLEPLGHLLVPIFFVLTGMSVNLEVLLDVPVLLTALGMTAVAVLGKVAAGLASGEARGWLVGWGMVPRGEVGLIFATIGQQIGVLPDREFGVIVIMVILTTLMTPPILSALLRRGSTEPTPAEAIQPA
jgi:Kef-type K+ transport system membrane component KefB